VFILGVSSIYGAFVCNFWMTGLCPSCTKTVLLIIFVVKKMDDCKLIVEANVKLMVENPIRVGVLL